MNKVEYRREINQYTIGFVGAALLTIFAYASVKLAWFDTTITAVIVLVLAVIQFMVQIRYFLHLRSEVKPRWKNWTFVYATIMMLVVVMGSLWVMYNLNYRMGMSGHEMEQKLLKENKKGF